MDPEPTANPKIEIRSLNVFWSRCFMLYSFVHYFYMQAVMDQLPRLGKGELRIIVTLGFVRLIYGSPELHFKAPGTVKIQIGPKLDVL